MSESVAVKEFAGAENYKRIQLNRMREKKGQGIFLKLKLLPRYLQSIMELHKEG